MASLNGLQKVTFFAWRTGLLVKLIDTCSNLNNIVLMNPKFNLSKHELEAVGRAISRPGLFIRLFSDPRFRREISDMEEVFWIAQDNVTVAVRDMADLLSLDWFGR
jgi:hypothetical protein